MKKNFQIIGRIYLVSIFALLIIGFSYSKENDLLEQSFEQAKSNDTVVDIGNTADGVGQWIFKGGTTINILKDGKLVSVSSKEPMLVKIAKLMIRIAIAVGITMFLYTGIQYLLSMGDQGKMSKALKNLVISGIGIILALLSMVIIDLITSITASIKI